MYQQQRSPARNGKLGHDFGNRRPEHQLPEGVAGSRACARRLGCLAVGAAAVYTCGMRTGCRALGSDYVKHIILMAVGVVWAIVAVLPANAETDGPSPGALPGALPGGQEVTGVVFHDANGNAARDADEDGLPGVRVSNGSAVVQTDATGRYKLAIGDKAIIFVIKPTGWATAADKDNLPQFYYVHRPDGSPKSIRLGLAPTGPLPGSVDFALHRQVEPQRFSVVFFADTQPRDRREITFMAHDVVEELVGTDAAFGVTLGDVTHNDLALFEDIAQTIGHIGVPWYNVKGNHDTNGAGLGNQFSSESFLRVFGPTYYSFDYGGVHFVALNNAFWIPGEVWYKIKLGTEQMEFLENDLALVPQDQLVVLLMHIPIIEMVDRQEIYRLLEGRRRTFSISGHRHTQEHLFIGAEDGWQGSEPHHHLVNVAVCGVLWAGAHDEAGIPHAMSYDGLPNGYSIGTFEAGDYSIRYKAARRPASYQMNVHAPDEVPAAETAATTVYANVFAGSTRSVVEMRLDRQGPWRKMAKVNEADPSYMQAVAVDAATSLPRESKLPPQDKCEHLWKASLPAEMTPGRHVIEVRSMDMFGKTDIGYRVVMVVAEGT